MTIGPINDFSIFKDNQFQTRSAQEKPVSRGSDKGASGVSLSGGEPVDSVELSVAAENINSASSQLADFDQAQGTLAMLKNKIHSQAGLALQAQANISPETAFALLSDAPSASAY